MWPHSWQSLFLTCSVFPQIPTDVRGLTFSRTPQQLLNILFLGKLVHLSLGAPWQLCTCPVVHASSQLALHRNF